MEATRRGNFVIVGKIVCLLIVVTNPIKNRIIRGEIVPNGRYLPIFIIGLYPSGLGNRLLTDLREFNSLKTSSLPFGKFDNERKIFIKIITKEELQKLIDAGILKNTNRGYVNKKGYTVGFYRTKGAGRKRWIEDWYADKAKKIK